MEVAAPTPQRAENHYPLLEKFLPSETLKALKEKFPSEREVNKLFLESGGVIEYLGTSYSVQFEWRQDSDETIKALFMLIHDGSEVTVTELVKNPNFYMYDYKINVLTPEAPPKTFSKTPVSTQQNFEIVPLTKIMVYGRQVHTEAPTLRGSLPEAFGALQKCNTLGLTKVQIVASSSSNFSSSPTERAVEKAVSYNIRKRPSPQPSTMKKAMILGALILAGGAAVMGIYGLCRIVKWAFNHICEAKANTTFDLSRIKTGDLSQIDSRMVLISTLILGSTLAAARNRALKLIGLATVGFGSIYYSKPELFQAAK